METKYYWTDNMILTNVPSYRIIRLFPYQVYSINSDAFNVCQNITNGTTISALRDRLEHNCKMREFGSVVSFINRCVENRILSTDSTYQGTLAIRVNDLNPPLERLFIEVTRRCNFFCKHCFMSATSYSLDDDKELSLDEIYQLLKTASDHGIYRADFTGGELFTRTDIKTILEYASSFSFITNIFTNGYALNMEMCEFLAKLKNIKTVFISLDDIDEKAHDSFRGMPGSFKKVNEGVENLKSVGISPVLNVTISSSNADHIKEIIDYSHNVLKIRCRIAPILHVGRGKTLDHENIDSALITDAMLYLHKAYNIRLSEKDGFQPDCGVGNKMIYVCSNGEICLCPTLSSREDSKFCLGNIRSDSMFDIWENASFLKIFRNSNCSSLECESRAKCKGGCRSRAFLNTGTIDGRDLLVCDFFNILEG